jgi:hypothetical protein
MIGDEKVVQIDALPLYRKYTDIFRMDDVPKRRTWLATRPVERFEFTFTPKHGSWPNLIEGFVSNFTRAVLRHIDDVNRHPVIHTWSYKLVEAA